jgi:hypothetical protein
VRAPQDEPESKRVLYSVGRYLGRALAAAFQGLPVRPQDLSEQERLDYVTLACQAIHRLADARARRPADHLPAPKEDSHG